MINTNYLLDEIWNHLADAPLEMSGMEFLDYCNQGGKLALNLGDTILLGGILDQIKMRQGTSISLLPDCRYNVAICLTLLLEAPVPSSAVDCALKSFLP